LLLLSLLLFTPTGETLPLEGCSSASFALCAYEDGNCLWLCLFGHSLQVLKRTHAQTLPIFRQPDGCTCLPSA